ncbi:hypothetical protein CDL15_Pgr028773 [Punica granatum]|uniref:Uncharacterized protein n=1 Tax=Punica granatum TaxID=22663 RepID=A0A218VX49_PUNGR|nr:hypothetical protein CDL15_Pgr028773 [Punica granatum]
MGGLLLSPPRGSRKIRAQLESLVSPKEILEHDRKGQFELKLVLYSRKKQDEKSKSGKDDGRNNVKNRKADGQDLCTSSSESDADAESSGLRHKKSNKQRSWKYDSEESDSSTDHKEADGYNNSKMHKKSEIESPCRSEAESALPKTSC